MNHAIILGLSMMAVGIGFMAYAVTHATKQGHYATTIRINDRGTIIVSEGESYIYVTTDGVKVEAHNKEIR